MNPAEDTNQHKISTVDAPDSGSIDTAAAVPENIDFPNDNHDDGIDDVDCCSGGGVGLDGALANHIDDNQQRYMALQLDCDHLKTVLAQKEETIEIQCRELRVLDREKSAISRDLEQSRREKETAVVKYAMVEKSLIDLRTSNEQLTRRLKDATKELDGHGSRMKFITGERERANRDLRKSANECEQLKTELVSLETKLKWNQVKIKQDAAAKTVMETRINELLLQVNQLTENQQQSLNAVKYEEKETEAQLILLKHTSEERDRECVSLSGRLDKLKRDYEEVCTNFKCSREEADQLKAVNCQYEATINRLESSVTEQSELIDRTAEELNEAHRLDADKQKRLDEAMDELGQLTNVKDMYEEQRMEIVTMRDKDENLMLFIKELTEKSVRLESQLTLATAKSAALALETQRIRTIYEEHKRCVVALELELLQAKKNCELSIVEYEKRVREATDERDRFELERDNALGELDANRRKNVQVIKELQREVQMERAKSEPTKSKDAEEVANREPSKKMLIDRIGRLQRALARQTEKIEFLENHCVGLINEIKCKS